MTTANKTQLVQRYQRLSRDCKQLMDKRNDYYADPEWKRTFEKMCETEEELRRRGIDPDNLVP